MLRGKRPLGVREVVVAVDEDPRVLVRELALETLDGDVRIYEAFAARLEKGDSAWAASDRLRTQEQALLQELRTRFQPINRLPRKDRETLASAMAEIFGLGS